MGPDVVAALHLWLIKTLRPICDGGRGSSANVSKGSSGRSASPAGARGNTGEGKEGAKAEFASCELKVRWDDRTKLTSRLKKNVAVVRMA